MVQLRGTFEGASDEEVYQAEQKALKAEGKPATKRWWSPGGTKTFANQKQPAKTSTPLSPYGYDSAMTADRGDRIIGTAPGTRERIDPLTKARIGLLEAQTGAAGRDAAGGGGSYRPTSTIQTTKTTYEGARPEVDLPEYDKAKIKEYRQKIAGPAMRRLRSEMRRALSASYENPNVRRHILRGALEGYGIGLGSITAESERAASQRYGQEYGQEYQRALQTYQAAMQGYLLTARQTTTSKTGYAGGTGYENLSPEDKEQTYREQQSRYSFARR